MKKCKGGDGRLSGDLDVMSGSDQWAFALVAAYPGGDSDHINKVMSPLTRRRDLLQVLNSVVCKGHPF